MKQDTLYFRAALLFTLLLGFIDEDYYSFKFLLDIGNIIVLSAYLLLFWAVEISIDRFFAIVFPAKPTLKKFVAVTLGLLLPITVIMLVA